jgi:hypothetical protein
LKSIKSKILTFAILATSFHRWGWGSLSFWRYQVVLDDNVSHELRTLASDTSGELTVWLRSESTKSARCRPPTPLSTG